MKVVVVGGGQAGLATGFYLRRAGLVPGRDFVVLDAADRAGGAWRQMWPTLRTFSPTQYSSLPGWMMPPWTADQGYPLAEHVVDYLTRYEERYELQVRRPFRVDSVTRADGGLVVHAGQTTWHADHVVSATGTWTRPFVPAYPGMFRGQQLHTSQYRQASDFTGQRVLIVGGGNSAAQILAEVSTVADTSWATLRPPRFLPDAVDGRVLFELASARQRARSSGEGAAGVSGLGDIVMVESVRRARDRGVLRARDMFTQLDARGVRFRDGSLLEVDTIIWCTGFRPSLGHLAALGLRGEDGLIATDGATQALKEPRLRLIGYGDWTGAASATLVGAGRTARDLVRSLTD
ncbi:ArsO family NAD(P)H-dependent flavin-containing monooxygenase [Kribbella shirazensis]|uniref:Cation diffusion facilitator CzcD-associated flavoprotein CzcO n=1 Tax=Kribbella shirazensis TaxID=1105143 RepID=A0A7X5VEL8_9ACTN|nr:ArsO family NAD(P)H-dependent flavin-containing monooxygenase [Kribbella shirazensis]NIK59815.1 cation diffusion facilitator CzcD-associated flavoprotein CzcO [Kribbella shirazensis]